MKGYLAVTNEKWYSSVKSSCLDSCVFWRKKAAFRALQVGEPFYFAGKRASNGDRYLIGKASFEKLEIIDAKKAWKEYGTQLGSLNEAEFFSFIEKFYKNTDIALGCIVLQKPVFLEKPVTLSSLGVDFSQYIVSGRIVDCDECILLDNAFVEE
mgnify:CR=1 FL=1